MSVIVIFRSSVSTEKKTPVQRARILLKKAVSASPATPRKLLLLKQLKKSEDTITSCQTKILSCMKRIKILRQANHRLKCRNAKLENVLKELKKEKLVSDNGIELLEKCSGGMADLLVRHKASVCGKSLPQIYSPQFTNICIDAAFLFASCISIYKEMFQYLPAPSTHYFCLV